MFEGRNGSVTDSDFGFPAAGDACVFSENQSSSGFHRSTVQNTMDTLFLKINRRQAQTVEAVHWRQNGFSQKQIPSKSQNKYPEPTQWMS